MQKNFTADINIKITKDDKNVVSIIPFSDKDKIIAKSLEKVLNDNLEFDGPMDFERADCLKRIVHGY